MVRHAIRFVVNFAVIVAATILVLCVLFGASSPWHKVDGGFALVGLIVAGLLIIGITIIGAWRSGHALLAYALGAMVGAAIAIVAFTLHGKISGGDDSVRLLVTLAIICGASVALTIWEGVFE